MHGEAASASDYAISRIAILGLFAIVWFVVTFRVIAGLLLGGVGLIALVAGIASADHEIPGRCRAALGGGVLVMFSS